MKSSVEPYNDFDINRLLELSILKFSSCQFKLPGKYFKVNKLQLFQVKAVEIEIIINLNLLILYVEKVSTEDAFT